MLIGIITFQWSYNCGSILQCVALKRTLEKKGCEVRVINYSSPEQQRLYSAFNKCSSFKNIAKNLLCLRGQKTISNHYEQYKKYIQQEFNYTQKPFSSSAEIEEHLPAFDALVAGGDQIWNVNCDDFTTAYMLDFNDGIYSFSYAPSLGATDITLATGASRYAELLKRFDDISCREPNGARWLEKLLDQHIELVLDPTLLTSPNDWVDDHDSSEQELEDNFIFYYAFTYSPRNNLAVQKLAEELNLRVIVIDAKQWYIRRLWRHNNFVLSRQTGPNAFLKYIKNADFVVTTSFHGTAFSVVFSKQFAYINTSTHNPSDDRTSSLIKKLGLEDRLITADQLSEDMLKKEIDYTRVANNLSEMQSSSLAYIERNLEHIRNGLAE